VTGADVGHTLTDPVRRDNAATAAAAAADDDVE